MGEQKPEDLSVEDFEVEEIQHQGLKSNKEFKRKIIIPNLIFHVTMHLFGLYGLYLVFTSAKLATFLWAFCLSHLTGWGVIVGAHRGYSHRSFKATTTLRVLLNIFQVMAGQNSLFTWARDHRIHHKYSDTDADPHNSRRGFFFAHVGWLMSNKHPLVIEKGKQIDVSDLVADKIVMFQHKYFVPLYIVIGVLIPVLVPYYLWNENVWTSFFVALCLRYVAVLNITWSVNSFAHKFGNKPYDQRIQGVQSKVVWLLSMGDGWHNYHHCFPWDYRSSEFGHQGGMATLVIDFCAYLGMAYDLRTAPKEIVHGHLERHGDGTHYKHASPDALPSIWESTLGIINKDQHM